MSSMEITLLKLIKAKQAIRKITQQYTEIAKTNYDLDQKYYSNIIICLIYKRNREQYIFIKDWVVMVNFPFFIY